MNIAVFGLGYVGTVTAGCLATNGHRVWGVDPDSTKVDHVGRGRSPVVEPGLDEVIARAVGSGDLRATDDPFAALAAADVSVVCVGTPSSPHGSTDLTHIRRAVKEIGQALLETGPPPSGLHCVVIRSTVPPGTVESVVDPILRAELGDPDPSWVATAMCPEFLREGSGLRDFFDPPFTVVGTGDARVGEAARALFGFIDRPLHVVPVKVAEALKFACNAFHATKVSFVNELSLIYRQLGVDSRLVMDLFRQEDRLTTSGAYLRPGFAFGGSCLPKDLRSLLYMARMGSLDAPVLAGTMASNELTVREAVRRIVASGARSVALLGLSFKSETDDLRESPNVELAEILLGKGFALRIYDPIVNPTRLMGANLDYVHRKLPHLRQLLARSAEDALEGADLAVVSTADAQVAAALVAARPCTVLDLAGTLPPEVEAMAGYQGIGW